MSPAPVVQACPPAATVQAAAPVPRCASISPPRTGAKERKGVKASKLMEEASARRAKQAVAVRTARAEEALECERLGEKHLSLFATLRSAATGNGVAVTSHSIDKSTVARLQRVLARLTAQGRVSGLPADWEEQINTLLEVAPPPQAPYDAFRGVCE